MNTMRNHHNLSVLVALIATVTLTSTHEASACGNAVLTVVDLAVSKLSAAEYHLHYDRAQTATRFVLMYSPRIRSKKLGKNILINRALRLMAVSVARLNGDFIAHRGNKDWPNKTEADRAGNLSWAIDTLQKLSKAKPDDPSLQTDLGEVLAKRPKHRAQAAKMLRSLEKRDLLTSAHGYRALAKLRRSAGHGLPSWLRAPLETLHAPAIALEELRSVSMAKRVYKRPLDRATIDRMRGPRNRGLPPPLLKPQQDPFKNM